MLVILVNAEDKKRLAKDNLADILLSVWVIVSTSFLDEQETLDFFFILLGYFECL